MLEEACAPSESMRAKTVGCDDASRSDADLRHLLEEGSSSSAWITFTYVDAARFALPSCGDILTDGKGDDLSSEMDTCTHCSSPCTGLECFRPLTVLAHSCQEMVQALIADAIACDLAAELASSPETRGCLPS